ncbi:MAG: orotate phosphoribosyltransferase-like protein [Methanocellales archaeon]|nr:orotate phosphoribosyltransferase-like protein [Methanocellales archaeon]MDD3292391.1 orotate phosphoribosyltransferase-like protein [Methanocellales archaeon]MDD5235896.1 orotate phosphoribosyltransferase-like protein [Methanocellales archaeon]MDD5485879.1 orotate phosphoribosyltransferase-like protein [Methanocellales archaeon]
MNIDELVKKAMELRNKGLRPGEIADELNVSSETVTWLLTRPTKEAPKDIFVDWSKIGSSSQRMSYIASALTDMVLESLDNGLDIDVVVGVALSGIPFASLVADELGVELAVFLPSKHRAEREGVKGTFSHNFAQVKGRKCIIIDDVITTGSTMKETVEVLEELGSKPLAMSVMIDKKGLDSIAGVPLYSLIKMNRVE